MVYKNLIAGQAQFGNIVVGRGTNILLDPPKFNADDVKAQDYQSALTDTVGFGQDVITPTTIEFTMTVLDNHLLPGWEGYIPNFWHSMPTVADVVKHWRFDDGRKVWGQMQEIYLANNKGEGRAIYGRPRTMQVEKPPVGALETQLIGEFQKADSLFYSVYEHVTELTMGATPDYIYRGAGDSDSYFRVWLQGPMTKPSITIGENEIKLDYNIATDEIVEISSYPWMKRVINNNRAFLAAKMTGSTPLDKLVMPANEFVPVRWTSEEYNTWIPELGNESWSEDFGGTDLNGVISWKLPTSFTQKAGKTVVRLDLFNPFGPRKYVASEIFGKTSSVIYNKKKFNSTAQYSEARIVEPSGGRSAMAIMCNEALTDGVALEVVSGFNNNKLRIRRVTSPTTLSSTILAEWTLGRSWLETDIVSIEYDPTTKTYIGKLNGDTKLDWPDPTTTKPITSEFRSQGFLFDLNGTLSSQAVGFRRIIAYDKAVVPAPTGRVLLFFRDAWASL